MNGFKIRVLGWQRKWKGFHMKYTLVLKYIQSLPDSSIVIFVDAFDSLILRTISEFARYFDAVNREWVVAASSQSKLGISRFLASKIWCSDSTLIVSCMWAANVRTLKRDIPRILQLYKKND